MMEWPWKVYCTVFFLSLDKYVYVLGPYNLLFFQTRLNTSVKNFFFFLSKTKKKIWEEVGINSQLV